MDLPPGLATPRDVIKFYDDKYWRLIETGEYFPYLYPWPLLGAGLIIGYTVLVDRRKSAFLSATRYPVYAAFAAYHVWLIYFTRTRTLLGGFAAGILMGFIPLWVFAWTICNDCQRDYKRMERIKTPQTNGHTNGSAKKINKSKDGTPATIYWQGYPDGLLERLSWVLDLACSIRGVGWTFQIHGIPRLPIQIERQLSERPAPAKDAPPDDVKYESVTVSSTGIRRYATGWDLGVSTIITMVEAVVALDLFKGIAHTDPYFWGYINAPAPDWFPYPDNWLLLRFYRSHLGLFGIYWVLTLTFTLGPLVFVMLGGPAVFGLRGEAWMNPAHLFGSPRNTATKGLAGWWAGWWHQAFRRTFEAPSEVILNTFGINKRSLPGQLVSLFVAFFFSGLIHAAASIMELGEAKPWAGSMAFFIVQPFGIIMHNTAIAAVDSTGLLKPIPKWIKWPMMFVIVHTWLTWTSGLLIDDFAQQGVFLVEPFPISPFRGMGMGAPNEGFWNWHEAPKMWYNGGSLLRTGLST